MNPPAWYYWLVVAFAVAVCVSSVVTIAYIGVMWHRSKRRAQPSDTRASHASTTDRRTLARTHREADQSPNALRRSPRDTIKVVGVGGGGVNAVNRMIRVGLKGAEFIAINTDAQSMVGSGADVKIDIGSELTRGLGAGTDPEVGRKAAEDHGDEIAEALRDADMVFVTAGEGGGTGTGGAPVVARIARALGALTVGVVTRPFGFEGLRRSRQAEAGIENLRDEVDMLVLIRNDRLLDVGDANRSVLGAFAAADVALADAVSGIADLVANPGLINDVRSVIKGAGTALMGVSGARGENRALVAADSAITSPLLEASIGDAHRVLLSIVGGSNLGTKEVETAAKLVRKAAHPEANIILGTVFDDALGDELRITVIAARFDGGAPPVRRHLDAFGTASGAARELPAEEFEPVNERAELAAPVALSTWERKFLELYAAGLSRPEIAREMGVPVVQVERLASMVSGKINFRGAQQPQD